MNTENRLNIAILTDGVFPFVMGGMQRHSHYLCRYLCAMGHQITLVHCVAFGKAIPTEEAVRSSMEINPEATFKSICLPFPKSGSLPGHYIKESYAYSAKVYDSIKTELADFDLIYAKGFSAWHLIDLKRKSKLKIKAPIAVKFHGYEMFQDAADFKSRLQHWLLQGPVKFNNRHADYIFSYGGKITTIIKSLGISNDKIIEIPTGIASSWFRSEGEIQSNSNPRKFVFVGRYERRKGIEELNNVLQKMLESQDFEFHFIGPIPASKKIKHAKLIYHGQQTETEKIKSILDSCEVLVTPSHSEGMPNVILEGMARGLAIIATDVGAVAAQVSAENGWLIEPADEIALEKALVEAVSIENAELRSKRLRSSQIVKEKFSWDSVSKITSEAFIRIARR